MSESPKGLNSELESFRKQWLSDLQSQKQPSARLKGPSSLESPTSQSQHEPATHHSSSRRRSTTAQARRPSITNKFVVPPEEEDGELYIPTRSFDEDASSSSDRRDGEATSTRPLVSALDHFEEAMEKEVQGNIGDSLKLYRQAYRMDHAVDKRYREKLYPAGSGTHKKTNSSSTPAQASSSDTSPALPSSSSSSAVSARADSHQSHGPPETQETQEPARQLSFSELITSFSALRIEPAPPVIEGDIPPPCPISEVPSEVLLHILQDVAIEDVGDFVRASLVCKRFAYLVAADNRIWERVCIGREWGFGGMLHYYNMSVEWKEVDDGERILGDGQVIGSNELAEITDQTSYLTTKALVPAIYPNWLKMFRHRPRIRFNGCYISTVNYLRGGQTTTNTTTWTAPVHIVTYYRYLRFYRDGGVISLLSTAEPGDVVHHMTKETLLHHRNEKQSFLPSAMMKKALKGRWRISTAENEEDGEGYVYVETEGAVSPYIYKMELSFRSVGKGSRNNKMAWRNFCSYNKLTDDTAPFMLKHDKAFFFSRVKSYGKGE